MSEGPRISTFLIGMVLVSLFVVAISLFLSELTDEYGTAQSDSIEVYNHMDALQSRVEQIQGNVTQIKEKTGILDVIGSYFSSGYQTLMITKDSFSTFDAIAEQAVDDANLGESTMYFKTAIIVIVLIVIFIAIVISTIVKRET